MAKEEKEKKDKQSKTPEQIEAEKAAKAAKKAEFAAAAKASGKNKEKSEAEKAAGDAEDAARAAKRKDAESGPTAFPANYRPRLYRRYVDEIAPRLGQELGVKNKMAIPRVTKVVISMGLGKSIAERPRLENAVKELTAIAGQKAVICKAKKSVSNFKLREGMEIGAKVTLRGNRMWEFLDRLIILAIPRVKDFRGLNPRGFDGRGNYNMGLTEQSVFPEIHGDQITFQQGMNITIVTTAGENKAGHALLRALGMPFKTEEEKSTVRKAG